MTKTKKTEHKEENKSGKYEPLRIELGALATGMFYSVQLERIQAFNRIRNIIYRELEGITITEKQDKKDIKEYLDEYNDRKLLKKIRELLPKLETTKQAYVQKILELLEDFREKEGSHKALMQEYIEQEPIYQQWLKNIKGISVINTANLLQYFGYCERGKHVSSLWRFSGLTPDSKREKGKSLDFNPKLRTLMYRIGDCFIKQRTPGYREVYDKAKEEYLKRHKEGKCQKCTELGRNDKPGHSDLMARRKMVKEFLKDYWSHCCLLTNRDPGKPYSARFHKGEE